MHPPVPPNIAYFLEHGLREAGRWRIPLILRLRPDVPVDEIRAVLTALTNHHDALRLRIVQRAGTWEQHIGEAGEFADLATRSLPDGIQPGSAQEREAVFDILNEQTRAQDLSSSPLTATYIRGAATGPRYLAISVHGWSAITRRVTSCSPTSSPHSANGWPAKTLCCNRSPHRGVSGRAVRCARYPSRCRGKPRLLAGDGGQSDPARREAGIRTTRRGRPRETVVAADRRRKQPDSMTRGAGFGCRSRNSCWPHWAGRSRRRSVTVSVAVDLGGPGRSVLKPDVDLRRTVGWFTTVYPVALACRRKRVLANCWTKCTTR